jgi:hypothetical protein
VPVDMKVQEKRNEVLCITNIMLNGKKEVKEERSP